LNDAGPWIALASLVVSLSVLLFGVIQYRRVARKDYVEELERQLERIEARTIECERERRELSEKVQECERERDRLERKTFELLSELRDRATGGGPPELAPG